MRGSVKAALFFGVGLLSARALASDFVDTRLTFLVSDEDVLVAPGQTSPSIPGVHVGFPTSQNLQFYDNFNTKYTGFENLSNLTLYKSTPTFFPGLDAEAALVLTLLDYGSYVNIQDQSSYIRLHYTPSGWDAKKEGFFLTLFPTSSDRMRLGFSYRISWGGDAVFPQGGPPVSGPLLPTTPSPGAKIEFYRGNGYAWIGAKGTELLDPKLNEPEVNYGILGGAGYDVLPTFRAEFNAAYFSQGGNPDTSVLSAPVWVGGASGRLTYHRGAPVGTSIDFALYRNDPLIQERFFVPEEYPGGLSYSFSLEGTYTRQALADPDVTGTTTTYPAAAGAFWARMKYDMLRAWFLAEYRDLSFIEMNQAGYIPYNVYPSGAKVTPEIFGAIGADYHFPRPHLTPGLVLGLENPSSFTSQFALSGNNPPLGLTGTHTVVIYNQGDTSVLPPGSGETLVFSSKATCKWDISDAFAAVGEVYFVVDNDRTTFFNGTSGLAEPVFQKPYELGFNAVLQARF